MVVSFRPMACGRSAARRQAEGGLSLAFARTRSPFARSSGGRLRRARKGSGRRAGSEQLELREHRLRLGTQLEERGARYADRPAFAFRRRLGADLSQLFPRAGDGEAVRVEQVLHLQQAIDIAPRVDALTLPRLLRPNRAKFRFPVAEHVRLDTDDPRNFADPVVELDRTEVL